MLSRDVNKPSDYFYDNVVVIAPNKPTIEKLRKNHSEKQIVVSSLAVFF